MRILIHSKTLGVFLQFSYGGAFFSFVPTIYATATTFANEDEAREYARGFHGDEFPDDLEFLPVDTNSSEASMADCIAAGVKPWEVRKVEPFKLIPHTRDVGHTMVVGASRGGMSALSNLLLEEYTKCGGKLVCFDK